MLIAAIVFGTPLLLALSGTGMLVDSIDADELGRMGVVNPSSNA